MADLENMVRDLNEMSERARDLRPVSDSVHRELARWQASKVHIEPKNNLDPSLENAGDASHVWRASGSKFTFGTSVPYARKVDWHTRKKLGLPSIIALPRATQDRITELLSDYVIAGEVAF